MINIHQNYIEVLQTSIILILLSCVILINLIIFCHLFSIYCPADIQVQAIIFVMVLNTHLLVNWKYVKLAQHTQMT